MNRRRILGSLPLVIALAGCGGGGPAPLPSVADARQALQTALDAWKAGKPAASLQAEGAKIEATDFEWKAGKALIDYAVRGESTGEGTQTFDVTLTLKGDPGPKEVKYMILGMDPVHIYRDEDFTRAMNMDNNPATPKKAKGRR